MAETRIHKNADEVIVDYLKDIRDQLAALNRKLDAMTTNKFNDAPAMRVFDIS